MNVLLSSGQFPSMDGGIRAFWAPVLLTPINGSYERLVVGVAAVSGQDFHLECANALDRLRCFYGDSAAGVLSAIKLASKCLETDLSHRYVEAIKAPDQTVSNVQVGECREAEGLSLMAISQSWMMALSSLYVKPLALEHFVKMDALELAASTDARQGGDRLPYLVCNFVTTTNPRFADFFSHDVKEERPRRVRGSSHKVAIDFSGSRIVANFGTLRAGSLTESVYRVKRRLWDLKVERDRESDSAFMRTHELIIQRPSSDDPQVTERQQSSISEALEELVSQADQEQLRLRPMGSVAEIGQHLLKVELAA
jgi:hypothetical protein